MRHSAIEEELRRKSFVLTLASRELVSFCLLLQMLMSVCVFVMWCCSDYMDRFGDKPDGDCTVFQSNDCYCSTQLPALYSDDSSAPVNSVGHAPEDHTQEMTTAGGELDENFPVKRSFVDSMATSVPYSSAEDLSSQNAAKRLRVEPIMYHTNVTTEVGN